MEPDPVDDPVHDVAIVGCGPVGSALAILLAQVGRSVVVLERWPQPYPLPRAVHFDHEVGRILQSCGIGAELAGISVAADVYEWRNAAGTTLLRFGRTGMGRSGWPQSSMFHQPALEALLAERLDVLAGVEVRRGIEVTGLRQGASAVTVTGEGADGAPVAVSARYVVGCDGANSAVRSILELPVHDLGFFYDWLIVDVVLHQERVFDPINLQVCDPLRPATAVSGGPGRRRWEFMRLPGEDRAGLDDERAAWRLLAPWDVTPDDAELERHAVYTFQARWVERWREGRVLLAGDAAHQMPPFAGQGLCAGIRDAANLAWKLDLVLDGRAGEDLLDTYQRERAPHVRAMTELSMELGKVICVADPEAAAERDALMAAGVVDGEVTEIPDPPGLTDGVVATGSTQAGELFPQGRIAAPGGEPARFDDLVGAGWRLVVGDDAVASGIDPVEEAWFATIGGRVVSLGAKGIDDVDGTYAGWFGRHGVVAALQRPDFHVYGTASDGAGGGGVDELLRSLRVGLGAVTELAVP